MVGGVPTLTSVSVWTTPAIQCSLPPLPRQMEFGHTVDYVLGKVIACYGDSCDQLTPSGWSSFSSTAQTR